MKEALIGSRAFQGRTALEAGLVVLITWKVLGEVDFRKRWRDRTDLLRHAVERCRQRTTCLQWCDGGRCRHTITDAIAV